MTDKYLGEPWALYTTSSLKGALLQAKDILPGERLKNRGRVYSLLKAKYGNPTSLRGRGFVNRYQVVRKDADQKEASPVPPPVLDGEVQASGPLSEAESLQSGSGSGNSMSRDRTLDGQQATSTDSLSGRTSAQSVILTDAQFAMLLARLNPESSHTAQVPSQSTGALRRISRNDLPEYEEKNLEAWFRRLECVLVANQVPESMYITHLMVMASGVAAEVLEDLAHGAFTYSEAKTRILQAVGRTREASRRDFLSAKIEDKESIEGFAMKLKTLLRRWLGNPKSEEAQEIHEQILIPQFIDALPQQTRSAVAPLEFKTLDEFAARAASVHVTMSNLGREGSSIATGKARKDGGSEGRNQKSGKGKDSNKESEENSSKGRRRSAGTCWECDQPGHRKFECPQLRGVAGAKKPKTA